MSSVGGQIGPKVVTLTAYVLPAAILWSCLGAASHFVAAVPTLASVMISLCLVYMISFGVIQTIGLPVRSPTLSGGVPTNWIQNRGWLGRTLVWGVMLGPGLVTVNPYASIWAVLMAVLIAGSGSFPVLTGAAVGVAHGAGRALGVMYRSANCSDPFPVMASQIRWRLRDGIALLIAFGLLSPSLLAQSLYPR